MTSRRLFLTASAAAAGWACFAARAAEDGAKGGAPIGSWGGVLEAGTPLRLRIDITAGDDGGLMAVLRSLDQDGALLEADVVAWDGRTLRIEFPIIAAAFEGRIDGPERLVGEWRQGGVLPLTLERDPDFEELRRRSRPRPLDQAGLEAYRARAGAPAMAAAARGADGRRLDLAVGLRSAKAEAPVTLDEPWYLGSITKSFTATLIARLVEAGRLSWETPLAEALPDLAGEMRDEYRGATLVHLLSHRAALPSNIPAWRLMLFPIEEQDPRESRRAYARIALAQEPIRRPGASFLYSNSGYVLAGLIAERAMGAPWEALIEEHVTGPMGLASAGHGAPGRVGALEAPVGHAAGLLTSAPQPYPPGSRRTDNPAVLGPAGRLHMRLADLLSFLEHHRDRTGFLTRASWDRLHTPPFGGGYALGWIYQGEGRRWHNGSNTLWYAEARFDRGAGGVAAVAANDGRLSAVAPQVSKALWAAEIAVGGG